MARRIGSKAAKAELGRRAASLQRDLWIMGVVERPTPPRYRSTARLGDWQHAILLCVAQDTNAAWLVATERERQSIDRRGIPWCPRGGDATPHTPSQIACISRALKRLEELGFVLRVHRRTSGRTLSVALTQRGWYAAQWLLGERLAAAPWRRAADVSASGPKRPARAKPMLAPGAVREADVSG